jgi:hypothetical protein
MDYKLITKKSKDLSTKFSGKYGITNKFCKGNSRGLDSRAVDHGQALGPPWTGGGADTRLPGHGGAFVGAWPPAAPGLGSSRAGVGHREGRVANPFRGSPGREGR